VAGATVRVSEKTHNRLRELAVQTGQPMQTILEQAVEDYRRRCFFDELSRAFAALRGDPQAWAQELEERSAWEVTIADGLDREYGRLVRFLSHSELVTARERSSPASRAASRWPTTSSSPSLKQVGLM
jgi:predicted transcriptional regulator